MKQPRRPAVLGVVFSVLATSHAVKTASWTAEGSQSQSDAVLGGSPVGKAVTLLEDLQAKVQQAQNVEQMTYMKYEMWCQLESQKTQTSIKTNEQLQEDLKATIAKADSDMKAASMHLAELASFSSTDAADLKAATILRKQENEEFKALETEILDGLKSTNNAVEKLNKAIEEAEAAEAAAGDEGENQEGGTEEQPALFMQKRSNSSKPQKPNKAVQAFGEVMAELAAAEELSVENNMTRHASLLEQSQKKASNGHMERVASELEHLGSSETKGDGQVQMLKENLELLNDVKAKSTSALDNARKREARYQANFERLREALQGKIDALARDLANTKKKLADATATKADSQGEMAVAAADIKASQEYLAKIGQDCMDKANQYQEQKNSRRDELLAIRNALKELKRIATTGAFSQLSFLQLSSLAFHEEKNHRPNPAVSLVLQKVENLAGKYRSPALTQLYSRMNAMSRYGGPQDDLFQKVRETIQEMVEKLERTNREEQTKKDFCDQETKHTQSTHADRKAEASKKKAALNLATAEVAQLRQDMADLSNELATIAKNDRDRSKMREDEHAAHVKAYKDLQEGESGIQAALKALRDFYAVPKPESSTDVAANMALAAQGKAPKLDTSSVGANAGAGVIGLLEVIEESFAKNMATLQAQDRNNQESYEEVVAQSKVLKAQKEGDLKHKTQEATAVERSVTELMSDHSSAQQQLEAIEEYMEKLKTECTAKVETREERIKKREKEVQGLQEALAILESES